MNSGPETQNGSDQNLLARFCLQTQDRIFWSLERLATAIVPCFLLFFKAHARQVLKREEKKRNEFKYVKSTGFCNTRQQNAETAVLAIGLSFCFLGRPTMPNLLGVNVLRNASLTLSQNN